MDSIKAKLSDGGWDNVASGISGTNPLPIVWFQLLMDNLSSYLPSPNGRFYHPALP